MLNPSKPRREPKQCAQCGQDFIPDRDASRFCGSACYGLSCRVKRAPRDCAQCGKPFVNRQKRVRFCGTRCSSNSQKRPPRPCKGCGGPISGRKDRYKTFCSRPCRSGSASRSTHKAGTSRDGYVIIRIVRDGRRTSVLEHRHIMEQHIGRRLRKDEQVHHIDHNPANNDIGNLEILSAREHKRKHIAHISPEERSRIGSEGRAVQAAKREARNCSPGVQPRCAEHGPVTPKIVGGIDYCSQDGCGKRTIGNSIRA